MYMCIFTHTYPHGVIVGDVLLGGAADPVVVLHDGGGLLLSFGGGGGINEQKKERINPLARAVVKRTTH